MQIGEAAARSGVTAKMIRHYEAIGLVAPAGRRANAYRDYGGNDLDRLRFIKRARDLGFPIDRIRHLLGLWDDKARASADVKAVALAHVAELERKITEMQALARTLHHLADACHGGARPDCPILDDLAHHEASSCRRGENRYMVG
jgi:MerR family copper efflux transcriptional regulator